MPTDTPRKWTKRGKDLKVSYQTDMGTEYTIAVRTTVDLGTGDYLTPVVPLLVARTRPNELPVDKPQGLIPRAAIACYAAPLNVQGVGKYRVVVPWNAASGNLRSMLKEIGEFTSASPNVNPPNVLSVDYEGESFKDMP